MQLRQREISPFGRDDSLIVLCASVAHVLNNPIQYSESARAFVRSAL